MFSFCIRIARNIHVDPPNNFVLFRKILKVHLNVFHLFETSYSISNSWYKNRIRGIKMREVSILAILLLRSQTENARFLSWCWKCRAEAASVGTDLSTLSGIRAAYRGSSWEMSTRIYVVASVRDLFSAFPPRISPRFPGFTRDRETRRTRCRRIARTTAVGELEITDRVNR